MESKIDPETIKIQALGAVLEPLLDDLVEIFGEVGAKMGPRWTQDGPSWQQVAPKMGHDSAKMTMLSSVWELLGGSWEHFLVVFFAIFAKNGRSVKTTNPIPL